MSQNGTTLNLQPTSSPTMETPAIAPPPPPPPPSPNMFGQELAHNTSNPPPINPSPVISTAIPSPNPQSSPPPINPPPPPVPVQTMPVPVPPSQPSSPPPPVPSPPPLPVPVDPIQGSPPSPTVPIIQTQPLPEIAEPAYQSPPLPPSQIATSEPPPSTPLPDQSAVTVPVPVPVFVPVYVPIPQSRPPPQPLSVPSISDPTSLTPRPPLAPPMKSSAQPPGKTEFLSGTPLVPVHKTAINTSSIVGIGVAIFLVVSLLVGLVVYLLKRKKRRHHGSDTDYHDIYSPSQNTPPSLVGSDNCYQMGTISYRHLSEITENFAQGNLIGEGGFARVYKGVINEGANRREVAVKQLKIEKNKGIQGERDFNTELEIIQRIHHRHLVDLLGYCLTDIHRLLVYEFVPNQTLDFHLHGSGPVMEWRYRMRAAIGSARGIAYLHEDCQPKIIHRDIKSANILLDNSFEAKVADFGLAKFTNDSNTHVSTRVVGTFGYMAPEYALSGKLTEKSDVFSFGVVLLELITGRKPVNPSDADEGLVEWARPLLAPALETQNFEILVDPKLGLNYVKTEMHRMINIAASCVRHSAINRPRMIQVLRSLEDDTHFSDLSNGVKIGDSTTYDSRLYSLEINRLHNMSFASSSS